MEGKGCQRHAYHESFNKVKKYAPDYYTRCNCLQVGSYTDKWTALHNEYPLHLVVCLGCLVALYIYCTIRLVQALLFLSVSEFALKTKLRNYSNKIL